MENPNNEIDIPDEVPDFGDLLKQIRLFHGTTIAHLSKKVGITAQKMSEIERSRIDLPPENILIQWLNLLGLNKTQSKKVIMLSRTFRVKHWILLHRQETSNPDMIRIMDAYRLQKLTDFDRTLLRLIAR